MSLEYLSKLLEEGEIEVNSLSDADLGEMNDYLTPLSFAAVRWPGSNTIILKNCKVENGNPIYPWKESTTLEAKNTLMGICKKTNFRPDLLGLLSSLKYIKQVNGKWVLTKRALVNFDEFFIEANPEIYKKCKVCYLIVEGNDVHDYCK